MKHLKYISYIVVLLVLILLYYNSVFIEDLNRFIVNISPLHILSHQADNFSVGFFFVSVFLIFFISINHIFSLRKGIKSPEALISIAFTILLVIAMTLVEGMRGEGYFIVLFLPSSLLFFLSLSMYQFVKNSIDSQIKNIAIYIYLYFGFFAILGFSVRLVLVFYFAYIIINIALIVFFVCKFMQNKHV